MVSLHLLATFVGALAVVYALPGPDMALMLQISATYGVRKGFATAGGLALARTTHVMLSALGVAALFRSAPWLYEGVRMVGGVYLAYVAYQIFRTPTFELHALDSNALSISTRAAAVKGTLSSILNPKALLFCSVLLPQFVLPQAGSMGWQIAELGIVLVALGVIFDVSLALCAVSLSRWLRKHPRAQALQRWTFSAVLLAFAVRLSTD